MEDIYKSIEWSPEPFVSSGSELSSPTAVNNNTSGSDRLTPLEELTPMEELTPEYNDHHNHHDYDHHNLLSVVSSLHTTVQTLTQTITSQRTEISNLATTITTQGQQIEDLQVLETTRLKRRVRNEVLDAYSLRSRLRREEWETVGCQVGHLHRGNAVEDAMMYIRGQRRDRSVWGRLYALTPERVMECYRTDDEATIGVLDKRATLLLTREEGDGALSAVEGAYRRFIHFLEHAWGEQPEEDMKSSLTIAYWTFWETCRTNGV